VIANSQKAEISSRAAARILRVSQTTVYRLIEDGSIKGWQLKAGGWWRIEYDSVIDYRAKILRLNTDIDSSKRPREANNRPNA
jgi:excisionase family DNA binding protein